MRWEEGKKRGEEVGREGGRRREGEVKGEGRWRERVEEEQQSIKDRAPADIITVKYLFTDLRSIFFLPLRPGEP